MQHREAPSILTSLLLLQILSWHGVVVQRMGLGLSQHLWSSCRGVERGKENNRSGLLGLPPEQLLLIITIIINISRCLSEKQKAGCRIQVIFYHWNINSFLRKGYKSFAFHFQTFWKAGLFACLFVCFCLYGSYFSSATSEFSLSTSQFDI